MKEEKFRSIFWTIKFNCYCHRIICERKRVNLEGLQSLSSTFQPTLFERLFPVFFTTSEQQIYVIYLTNQCTLCQNTRLLLFKNIIKSDSLQFSICLKFQPHLVSVANLSPESMQKIKLLCYQLEEKKSKILQTLGCIQ